jgi:phosphorylcholine metabolism protein LicD
LLELVDYTKQLLEKLGITYWLDLGSLLGAYRNNQFIPWDCDVDMSIYLDDAGLLLSNSAAILEDGYLLRYRLVDRPMEKWVNCDKKRLYYVEDDIEIFRIQLNNFNKLHIDLFPATRKNGIVYRINKKLGNKQGFPESFCNFGTIDLYGRKLPCPEPVGDYLGLMYGSDYMTPKRLAPKWE